MEELFKHRQTALLFIAMAVLVAPLVEETLFRGYLYPMFARSFGIWPGIILTGVLFGFMHGAQLGWTWSLVSVLCYGRNYFHVCSCQNRKCPCQFYDAPRIQLADFCICVNRNARIYQASARPLTGRFVRRDSSIFRKKGK